MTAGSVGWLDKIQGTQITKKKTFSIDISQIL